MTEVELLSKHCSLVLEHIPYSDSSSFCQYATSHFRRPVPRAPNRRRNPPSEVKLLRFERIPMAARICGPPWSDPALGRRQPASGVTAIHLTAHRCENVILFYSMSDSFPLVYCTICGYVRQQNISRALISGFRGEYLVSEEQRRRAAGMEEWHTCFFARKHHAVVRDARDAALGVRLAQVSDPLSTAPENSFPEEPKRAF